MSAVNNAVAMDPFKLYQSRDRCWGQLEDAVRTKIDHLTSILGANGVKLQQIRTKKLISDDSIPQDIELAAPGLSVYSNTTVKCPVQSKLFSQKGTLLAINQLFKESVALWRSLQHLITEKGEKLVEADTTEITAQVARLADTVFIQVLAWQWFYAPRNKSCEAKTLRIPGLPPASGEVEIPLKLPVKHKLTPEEISGNLQELTDWFEERRTNTIMILVFAMDPSEQEYVFNPTRQTPYVITQDKFIVKTYGTLTPFEGKIFSEVERAERLISKYRIMRDAEKNAIDDAMVKLRNYLFFSRQIADLPKHVARPQVFSAEVISLSAANSKQRPKKGKTVEPAVDPIPLAAVVEKKEAVALRPKVVLRDSDDHDTFSTLMGRDKKQVCWNDVVHCLQSLGYEVTQNPGSNTWKFKWKTQSWLRDEKTIEELADEVEPTTVAATSMHLPHQNGLSTRSRLDEGRLSSFKKLLEESGFDLGCVTLKTS